MKKTKENPKNDLKDGPHTEYFKNRTIKEECNYKGGLKEGLYIRYHKNGELKEEGGYHYGKRAAIVKYNDKGKVIYHAYDKSK